MGITRGQLQAVIECVGARWGEYPDLVVKYEGRKGGRSLVNSGDTQLGKAVEKMVKANVKNEAELKTLQRDYDKLAVALAKEHKATQALAAEVKKLQKAVAK